MFFCLSILLLNILHNNFESALNLLSLLITNLRKFRKLLCLLIELLSFNDQLRWFIGFLMCNYCFKSLIVKIIPL